MQARARDDDDADDSDYDDDERDDECAREWRAVPEVRQAEAKANSGCLLARFTCFRFFFRHVANKFSYQP